MNRAVAAGWRADIDGLRALAILAVVGYHFFPRWLPAGFIGVDVFFVISGYLITGILLRSQEAGRHSVAAFYAARVRRIFPALVLVLAFVLLVAWACLFDDELLRLGRHVLGAAGFASNLVLWQESGYFDAAIESKPLAHLWSLGVEEQFYLLWPPLLLWLARSRHAARLLALLLGASFAACIVVVATRQGTAFYVPVFRFWELLAGAGLAMLERGRGAAWPRRRSEWLSACGAALLALALVLVRADRGFPGWPALLPVAGATLVIAAGPAAAFNRLVLSRRALVGIGLVSYPLYLWHWPLLALTRIAFNREPTPAGMAALFAASLLLAWATWQVLEKPVRAPAHPKGKVAALAACMLGVAFAGLLVRMGDLPGRLHERMLPGTGVKVAPDLEIETDPDFLADCRLADPAQAALLRFCGRDARGDERFALVGDSKAGVLFHALMRTSGPDGRWLFAGGSLQHSSVVPALSDAPQFRRNQDAVRVVLDAVTRNPRVETVLVAASTRGLYALARQDTIEDLPDSPNHAAAVEGLRRFTAELLRAGKKVVLLVDNPTLADPLHCMRPSRFPQLAGALGGLLQQAVPGCEISVRQHRAWSARYLQLLQEVRALAPARIAIVDTIPLLCNPQTQMCAVSEGDTVLYSYDDHVSGAAAERIALALNAMLGSRSAAGCSTPPAPPAGSCRNRPAAASP